MNGGQRPFLPTTLPSPTGFNGRFPPSLHFHQPCLTAVSPHHLIFINRT
ncbi:MAG: hypothetical protein H6668_04570 [Ardenticatenaceae bacterium]|nr:hypothetical protein [Ardenticatenaceae bacterium]